MSASISSGNNLNQRPKSAFGQKNLPTQTSNDDEGSNTILLDIYKKIRNPVLFFCRRVIFGPTQFKLLVSFAIIVIGSILKTMNLAPNSYLSLKHNIFNRYFAKLGWAWTIGLLLPFIYLTLMTTHNIFDILIRHLVRLLVATGVWYIITYMFVSFEAYTGQCKHADMIGVSRKICLSGGHEWQEGHDFSGHTFLLLYSLLIINEEVKSYDKGTKKVDQASKATAKEIGDSTTNSEHEKFKIISQIIRILYILLAALTILWEFMLLSTALYFHHTSHKLVAAGVAVFFWYITYYQWYQPNSTSLLRPSSPKN